MGREAGGVAEALGPRGAVLLDGTGLQETRDAIARGMSRPLLDSAELTPLPDMRSGNSRTGPADAENEKDSRQTGALRWMLRRVGIKNSCVLHQRAGKR
ncbi:hypothetical protein EYF80_046018 [Liparis tanakae]|uniref:Uncharacterized protein n=1 Tax=Liparis tanakae TaxID=230148 RepID=A0A4Z2FS04_9TELE|nr:hypothetical protein EYF80_046018 [Liparis tanakae]